MASPQYPMSAFMSYWLLLASQSILEGCALVLQTPTINDGSGHIAWCGTYLEDHTKGTALNEWLQYYKKLGIDAFTFYGDSTSIQAQKLLGKWQQSVKIEPCPDKCRNSGLKQTLMIRDCFQKSRGFKWVFFGDIDEYLSWEGQELNLKEFLNRKEFKGQRWISFGPRFFSSLVTNSSSEGRLSRLLTPEFPYCFSGMHYNCGDDEGRRKYALQPEHWLDDLEGSKLWVHGCRTQGYHVDVRDARFDHWRGIASNEYWQRDGINQTIDEWVITKTDNYRWYGNRSDSEVPGLIHSTVAYGPLPLQLRVENGPALFAQRLLL